MYTLLAEAETGTWSGEIGREEFETLDAAERQMDLWARFGVDGYCNEADRLSIFDAGGAPIRNWNWRRNRVEPVQPATPG